MKNSAVPQYFNSEVDASTGKVLEICNLVERKGAQELKILKKSLSHYISYIFKIKSLFHTNSAFFELFLPSHCTTY